MQTYVQSSFVFFGVHPKTLEVPELQVQALKETYDGFIAPVDVDGLEDDGTEAPMKTKKRAAPERLGSSHPRKITKTVQCGVCKKRVTMQERAQWQEQLIKRVECLFCSKRSPSLYVKGVMFVWRGCSCSWLFFVFAIVIEMVWSNYFVTVLIHQDYLFVRRPSWLAK